MAELRILVPLVALAAVLSLGGCGSEDSGPVGTWGEKGDSTPYLDLTADGKVSGSDGCNRLMSRWTADGDEITFEQMASTKMACPELDTWLSGAASAEIDGTTLIVRDADGEEIGQLER